MTNLNIKFGDDAVKSDRSTLRVIGSVGEPLNPEAWKWLYEVVGHHQCAIVDTYWQTETGKLPASPSPLSPSLFPSPYFPLPLYFPLPYVWHS
jgi:acetyl-CoA synthetase